MGKRVLKLFLVIVAIFILIFIFSYQLTGHSVADFFSEFLDEGNLQEDGIIIQDQSAEENNKLNGIEGSNEYSRLFIELVAEKIDGKIEIVNKYYSCAGPNDNNDLYDTMVLNLRNIGESYDENPYDTISLDRDHQSAITWHLMDHVDNFEDDDLIENDNFNPIYSSNIFIKVPSCPTQENPSFNLKLSSSKQGFIEEDKEIQFTLEDDSDLFNPIQDFNGGCEIIKEATNTVGKQLNIVFHTDISFEDYAYSKGPYYSNTPPLTENQVREIVNKNFKNIFTDTYPLSSMYESINIYWAKSQEDYSICSLDLRNCPTGNVYSDAISLCALYRKENVINNVIISGIRAGNTGGRAYLKSQQTFNFVYSPVSPPVTYGNKIKNLEIWLRGVITHEFGHAIHNLDHLSGNSGHADNDPRGLIWTGQDPVKTCESNTKDKCILLMDEPRYGSAATVATTTSVTTDSIYPTYNYMGETLSGLDVINYFSSSHQQYGINHVVNNIFIPNFKDMGIIQKNSCGNGIVEQGEDLDGWSSLYQYDIEEDVLGYCINLNNEEIEMRNKYPFSYLGPSNNDYFFFQDRFSLVGESKYYPGIETIRANKKTCRIYTSCSNFQIHGSTRLSPEKTDCSIVDYRFEKNKFSIIPGEETCEGKVAKNSNLPLFPEDTANIVVAYEEVGASSNLIKVVLLDTYGRKYSSIKSFQIPSNYGKLLELKVLDFDPRYIAWNYNTKDSFQPYALFAIFENQIVAFHPGPTFNTGIDMSNPSYRQVITISAGIEKIIDISYLSNTDEVVITYQKKKTPSGTNPIYQIRKPTYGGFSSENLIISDSSYLSSLPSFGISDDKSTIISFGEKMNPFEYAQTIIQQTKSDSLSRSIGSKPLQDVNVWAKPVVSTDNFGRYIFTELTKGYGGKNTVNLRYSTLTYDGIRKDLEFPISISKGDYTSNPTNIMKTVMDKRGARFSAFPIEGGIAYVDGKGKLKELDSSSGDFDLDVFQGGEYTSTSGFTETDPLILLERNNQGKLNLILVNGYYNYFKELSIDSGSTDYKNLEVHATIVGPRDFLLNRFECTEVKEGFLSSSSTGNAGNFGWPLIDISSNKNLYLLESKKISVAPNVYVGEDGIAIYDLVDGTYGNYDDKLIGFAKLLSSGKTLVAANFKPDYITNGIQEPKAIALLLEDLKSPQTGRGLVAYEADAKTGEVKKIADLPYYTNQYGQTNKYSSGNFFLSGDRIYFHNLLNELYYLDFYKDADEEPKRILPNPGASYSTSKVVWNEDGLIAIASTNLPSPGTHIYDGDKYYFYPKVAKYFEYDKAFSTFKITYEESEDGQIITRRLIPSEKGLVELCCETSISNIIKQGDRIFLTGEVYYGDRGYIGSVNPNGVPEIKGNGGEIGSSFCEVYPNSRFMKMPDNSEYYDYFYAYDPIKQTGKVFSINSHG